MINHNNSLITADRIQPVRPAKPALSSDIGPGKSQGFTIEKFHFHNLSQSFTIMILSSVKGAFQHKISKVWYYLVLVHAQGLFMFFSHLVNGNLYVVVHFPGITVQKQMTNLYIFLL